MTSHGASTGVSIKDVKGEASLRLHMFFTEEQIHSIAA